MRLKQIKCMIIRFVMEYEWFITIENYFNQFKILFIKDKWFNYMILPAYVFICWTNLSIRKCSSENKFLKKHEKKIELFFSKKKELLTHCSVFSQKWGCEDSKNFKRMINKIILIMPVWFNLTKMYHCSL